MTLAVRARLAVPFIFLLMSYGIDPARADKAEPLDVQLIDQARKVVDYLKDRGRQNVGVLKFRVQLPGQPPTLLAGALNTYMAERLENALILALKEDDGIRVIHRAGNVISRQAKRLSYLEPAEARALFALDFPAAWGGGLVKADVFLTGLVRCEKRGGRFVIRDVSVDALGRDGTWVKVLTFTPATDSQVLADLGVSRRARAGEALADFDDVPSEPVSKAKEVLEPAQSPRESRIKFTAFYGDTAHEPRYDELLSSREVLPEPKTGGQRVRFEVRNLGKDTVGLVVLVNGVNTLDKEIKKSPALYRKWVLEPGKDYAIAGYHVSQGGTAKHTVEPFRTFSDEEWESLAVDLPEPGLIQLLVFKMGSSENPPVAIEPTPVGGMKVSLRGLEQSKALVRRSALSLDNLKYNLNLVSGRLVPREGLRSGDPGYEPPAKASPAIPRGGLGGGKQEGEQVLEFVDLPNATLIEQRFIQFWTPRPKK